jgi:hypothetical protein
MPVVMACAAAAVLLAWAYFRRYRLTRPPIGVLDLRDVLFMVGGIVLVPYLYVALPRLAVAGLLALSAVSVLYFVWEPVLRARWAIWLAVLVLAAADIGAAARFGATSVPFFAVNDLVMLLAVAGIANLWAQSGLKARDAAALAAALTIYDYVATWRLSVMNDLFTRLSGLPFALMVAWPVGDQGLWLGIGFGDLLLAAAFPLVMRKAYGRPAGLTALAVSIGTLAAVIAYPWRETFPVMIVLGPLMLLQYAAWARRSGRERTTWQYLRDEPPRAGPLPPAVLEAR